MGFLLGCFFPLWVPVLTSLKVKVILKSTINDLFMWERTLLTIPF